MNIEATLVAALDFVRAHKAWAPPLVALVAFCEGVIILSLIVPASVILVGVGAIVAAGDLDLWVIILAASIGAALGEWASFVMGLVMKDGVRRVWPLSRYPETVDRSERLIQKWGYFAIIAGKFIGPLRGIIPLLAGAFRMNPWKFQLANWGSSVLWAIVFLMPGYASVLLATKPAALLP